MNDAVIVDAVRTPIGRKGGTLSQIRPDALYASILDALIERTGIEGAMIEDVVTGCVTQAGEQGANVGRLGVLLSRLPKEVAGVTLNRMCGSSQQAIHFASQAVAAGDMKFVIAGGVESMSRVPMFSDIQGGFEKLNPALGEKHEIVHQGESAERIADRWNLSRHSLDEFAARSHTLAGRAIERRVFDSQLAHLAELADFTRDEGVRAKPDRTKMASLPPVFRANGVVTAANSSQISDGAAAVLVADADAAKSLGLVAKAKFRARVTVAGDPTLQLMEVVPATRRALERAGLSLPDIDLIEINEAFATVVLAWAREVKADMERVNPNGGAIAHGHPLGATGAVLATKIVHELHRRDLTFGLQVMCIGHGMATATIYERV